MTTAPEPSHWDYTYDALGQVTSGLKRWSDSTLVAGAQFNYSFDSIGNRLWTEAGGDAAGNGLRHAAYTNNLLNQITARDVPGAADVTGSAHPQVAVTVNGSTANRHSDYYHQVLTWNNATGAVWAAVTNRAQCQGLSDTATGHLLLPQTPETFLYDQDGNLLQDGLWDYTWDAENRLTRVVSRTATPRASWQALDFCYDWLGRRVGKVVSTWNETNQTYEPSRLRIYSYAGWNLQVEVDETGYPARSFTWGTDASGTLQGAGGVGGLLSMTLHRGTNAGTYFYCYDGNWNVVALVNAATGEVAAQYDYGPFHELLRATGPVARENPFLAATKYYDWEAGLYYYGHRCYSPSNGRWLSRDPLSEELFWRNYVKEMQEDDRTVITQERASFQICPYTFSLNSPPSVADIDGARSTPRGQVQITLKNRRDPPSGMQLVTVDKCNIKILYGHNWVNDFSKKGLQWIWNIVPAVDTQPAGSAYAAVVSCIAYVVPNEIPLPGYTPVKVTIEVNNAAEDTDLGRELDKAMRAARDQAKAICRLNCGCKKVKIRAVSYGLSIGERLTYPSLPDVDVDCKDIK